MSASGCIASQDSSIQVRDRLFGSSRFVLENSLPVVHFGYWCGRFPVETGTSVAVPRAVYERRCAESLCSRIRCRGVSIFAPVHSSAHQCASNERIHGTCPRSHPILSEIPQRHEALGRQGFIIRFWKRLASSLMPQMWIWLCTWCFR